MWYSIFPVLFITGFGLCLFLLYNLMPVVMKLSSATVVNLSLLTADFYSLFCGLFLFHYKVSYAFDGIKKSSEQSQSQWSITSNAEM